MLARLREICPELANTPEVSTLTVQITGLISRRKSFEGKYSSQIAHAYKTCFDGNCQGAISILNATRNEILGVSQQAAADPGGTS